MGKVDTDRIVFDNKDSLITGDFTNFGEKDYLSDTKSTTVIKKLKVNFVQTMDSVISDNNPNTYPRNILNFS